MGLFSLGLPLNPDITAVRNGVPGRCSTRLRASRGTVVDQRIAIIQQLNTSAFNLFGNIGSIQGIGRTDITAESDADRAGIIRVHGQSVDIGDLNQTFTVLGQINTVKDHIHVRAAAQVNIDIQARIARGDLNFAVTGTDHRAGDVNLTGLGLQLINDNGVQRIVIACAELLSARTANAEADACKIFIQLNVVSSRAGSGG